jgi:hypothetical protein
MVSIEVTPRDLVIRIRGWDRVRALRTTLSVPHTHVSGVHVRPKEARFDDVIVESWRGVGTYRSGSVAAGLVYLADGPAFYDVHDPERCIAIDLVSERFRRLVVEVADESPERAAKRIRDAIGERRAAKHPVLAGPDVGASLPRHSVLRPSPWRMGLAIAAVIMLAPLGMLTAFFVIGSFVPLLLLILPAFVKSASRGRAPLASHGPVD